MEGTKGFIQEQFTSTKELCFDCHGKGCSRCKSTGYIYVWRNKQGYICFTTNSQDETKIGHSGSHPETAE